MVTIIVQEGLSSAGAAFTLAVFTIVASLSIAVLSIAVLLALCLAGGASARARVDRLRIWLNPNNATVMAVLLVLGVVLPGQGLGG